MEGRVFWYGYYVSGVKRECVFCVGFGSSKALWSTFRKVLHKRTNRASILEELLLRIS